MSNCPFEVEGCPGFASKAPMYDLCDDCYEDRRAEGDTEETKEPLTCEDYMEEQGERDMKYGVKITITRSDLPGIELKIDMPEVGKEKLCTENPAWKVLFDNFDKSVKGIEE